jgi:hypothetical protein
MPFGISFKQTVTITPALLNPDGTPQTDEWNRPVTGTPYVERCAIFEGTKLVRSMTGGSGVHGVQAEEVVSVARIFFDKRSKVDMHDIITFIDEDGFTRTYKPISIENKRLSGNRILKVVNV